MVIVFFTLALASVIYIGVPLLSERLWPQLESRPASQMQREKREGIWAISDVDNEYEIGKITEEDHLKLRASLKEELAEIMQRERNMMKAGDLTKDRDIPRPLKKRLLFEVMRICGIQGS